LPEGKEYHGGARRAQEGDSERGGVCYQRGKKKREDPLRELRKGGAAEIRRQRPEPVHMNKELERVGSA